MSNVPLSNLAGEGGRTKQHLLVSLTLPESAGDEFQGLSSVFEYVFAASWSPGDDTANSVHALAVPYTPESMCRWPNAMATTHEAATGAAGRSGPGRPGRSSS